MKVAHISDIHYSQKNLKWVDLAMDAAVTDAIKAECDAAVISGDSFDHGLQMHDPSVEAYIKQIVRLASAMPVLILQGTFSHDRPGSLSPIKHIPTKHQVLVADEVGAHRLRRTMGGSVWEDLSEPLDKPPRTVIGMFFCLPSINKADTTFDLQATMDSFAVLAEGARKSGIPTVLTTHGTVQGSVTESKYAMVSPDHEFTSQSLFSSGADAIMLGHIHAQQQWTRNGQIVAYAGSLARLVHGDHDPKGWLLWDVVPGDAAYVVIESPTRQLIEIEFDGPPNMEDIQELADTAGESDAIRIRWSIDQEFATTIDKEAIRVMFKHCDTVKLEATVLPVQSVRAEGITSAVTLQDKMHIGAVTIVGGMDIDALDDRLWRIQSMETEKIIKDLKRS